MGQTPLPYEENFDSYSSGATPSGWNAITGSASIYFSATPTTYVHSGSNSLRISNSSTGDRVIALPQFENETNTLQISFFHVAGSSSHGNLEIGYVTDISDATTFTPITSYQASNSTVYQEVEISMATAPTGARIAFHHTGTANWHYWYIDDVIVETIPTNPKPKNLVCSSFSNSRATLGWTNGGSETAWQVAYSTTATFNPDEVTHVDVNTNPATITGLSGNTTYYACVRANLGNNTYSRWSYKCTFTTKCDPIDATDFPIKEEFAYVNANTEVPECWDNSQGNPYGASYKWKLQNSNGQDGSTKGFIQMSVSGPTGTYYNYLISQMMNIPNENMKLSFYFKKTNQTKGRLDVYISVDGVIANTPIASDISVSSTDWELKEFDLPAEYKDTDNVAIVFKGTSASNSSYLCIDDVKMEIVYSCVKPVSLAVSSITSSSATLSWTDGGQDSWDVYYSTSSVEPDQETTPDFSNLETNSCTLILQPHKKYYAWVRAKCGDNDYSSWSDAISFATPTTLPYSYNFTESSDMGAWTMNNCYPSLTGRTGSGSDYYFHFFATSQYYQQYLISPLFENNSYALLVSFDYKLTSGSSPYPILKVGYSTSDIETFTWPEDATVELNSTSYQRFEYLFSTNNIKYIAIQYYKEVSPYLYADIDNISFTPIDKVYTGGSEEWNYLADWTPAGLPESTDDVYINNTITIPNTCTAEANNIILGPSGSLTIADGGQLVCNNLVAATVKKSIEEAGKWHLITSPVYTGTEAQNKKYITIGNTTTVNLTNDKYDMFAYDEENMMWLNQKNGGGAAGFDKMYQGQGYLYRNENDIDLSFVGNTNVGDVVYSLSCTVENDLSGFNLIGNPYPHSIAKGEGKAIDNESLASGYYTLNENQDAWLTCTDGDEIEAMQGILVQTTETLADFTIKDINYVASAKSNHDNIMFKVENSEYSDISYAIFDKGYGLSKINHRNQNVPMLYIPQDDEDYAIAMMSDDTKTFNLNFKAMTTGSYTLSYKATGDFSYLHVIDRLTGEDVDMLVEGEYSFIGSPMDNENRFIVRLEYSANSESSDNSVFAYQNGNDIVVNGEGELQVFDVMGRKVMTTTVNGVETINFNAQGVYIFKLNEKTQKIVVK